MRYRYTVGLALDMMYTYDGASEIVHIQKIIQLDSNYLKRSFVNDEYEIIGFDGTLSQLSAMIYNRSVVMMEEYDRRIYKNRKPR